MAGRDLIAVLAGGIYRRNGIWQTNDADGPGDGKGGATYDRFRVVAGACLAEENPAAWVLATGAVPRPEAPTVASVIRGELIALGVAAERIRLEDQGPSTYRELVEIRRLVAAQALGAVLVVTNEWHVPRVAAMLARAPGLDPLRAHPAQIIAAEAVLLRRDAARWAPLVAVERNDPRMAQRVALETKGTEQIYAGTYRF